MEEMVAEFLPFFLFVSYFCHKTKEDGKDDLQDSIVRFDVSHIADVV
jgi:hypothetical protein